MKQYAVYNKTLFNFLIKQVNTGTIVLKCLLQGAGPAIFYTGSKLLFPFLHIQSIIFAINYLRRGFTLIPNCTMYNERKRILFRNRLLQSTLPFSPEQLIFVQPHSGNNSLFCKLCLLQTKYKIMQCQVVKFTTGSILLYPFFRT